VNTIRAYHLLPSQHALTNLRHRRLKIAQIDDLNDPFDLWAVAQPDLRLRKAIRETKDYAARSFGMVCFSLSWRNPLLWSHYAERHRGIALGFDINKAKIKRVSYVKERPIFKAIDLSLVHQLLFTKYIDWSYEREVRVFTRLEEKDSETGLYFADFTDDCVLREVIVGPLSNLTHNDLQEALGEHRGQVILTKARLAFNSFNVVKNRLGFKSTERTT
jgi:hypothetical protein